MSREMSSHARYVSILDYSTIDMEQLRKQPVYRMSPKYHFNSTPGACFNEPPGHPTYFTWSVYHKGNQPDMGKGPGIWRCDHSIWGVAQVITDPDDKRMHYMVRPGDNHSYYDQFWKPLPEEHPRVQAWLSYIYRFEIYMYSGKMDLVARDLEKRIKKYYPDHLIHYDWLTMSNKHQSRESNWWSVFSEPLLLENVIEKNYWSLGKLSNEQIAHEENHDPLFDRWPSY